MKYYVSFKGTYDEKSISHLSNEEQIVVLKKEYDEAVARLHRGDKVLRELKFCFSQLHIFLSYPEKRFLNSKESESDLIKKVTNNVQELIDVIPFRVSSDFDFERINEAIEKFKEEFKLKDGLFRIQESIKNE